MHGDLEAGTHQSIERVQQVPERYRVSDATICMQSLHEFNDPDLSLLLMTNEAVPLGLVREFWILMAILRGSLGDRDRVVFR
ncbi:hypothetical protein [Nitrospira sp. Nam74]